MWGVLHSCSHKMLLLRRLNFGDVDWVHSGLMPGKTRSWNSGKTAVWKVITLLCHLMCLLLIYDAYRYFVTVLSLFINVGASNSTWMKSYRIPKWTLLVWHWSLLSSTFFDFWAHCERLLNWHFDTSFIMIWPILEYIRQCWDVRLENFHVALRVKCVIYM